MNKQLELNNLHKIFDEELNAESFPIDISHEDIVKHYSHENDLIDDDQPFYIVNLSYLIKQVNQWKDKLNNIQPFYAVKCNPNPFIIRVLYELNINFDCASENELKLVIKTCPNIDLENRIIYAHPTKPISHIKTFRNSNCKLTVVDSCEELYKIKKYWPQAKILIRLKVEDTTQFISLSYKFGANEDQSIEIIKLSKELNLNLVGCSFHAGTPCHSSQSYVKALYMAYRLFNIANQQFNLKFNILDIGGGFNPDDSLTDQSTEYNFSNIASTIKSTIDQLFSSIENIQIISEPGRYFVENCAIFVSRIIARKQSKNGDKIKKLNLNCEYLIKNPFFLNDENGIIKRISPIINDTDFIYYINEGIYGVFNSFLFEPDLVFKIYSIKKSNEKKSKIYRSTLFGPTCDSRDLITPSINLPKLDVNDIIYITNAGSYTNACTSTFNGFFVQKYYFIYQC